MSCAVALLLGGLSGSAQATFPGERGKIVFFRGNDLDVVNADGTGFAELLGEDTDRHRVWPRDTAWSPDGRYVAFKAVATLDQDPHPYDIAVVNAETGDWHWLTTSGRELVGDSYAPTWVSDDELLFTYRSLGGGPPDGTYATAVNGGAPHLYKAGPETRAALAPASEARAAYIRDGALYVSDETKDRLNGTQIAAPLVADFDWSPDGRRIAYSTYPFGHSEEARVWIVDADGRNAHDLAAGSMPKWSPDGAKIVFYTVDGLAIIDSSGRTSLRHIVDPATGETVWGLAPDWQPAHPTAPSAPAVPLSADMGVTAVGRPTELRVGDQVTYTATVTNHGPGTAVDVVLSVDLPDSLSSVVLSSTAGSCSSIRPVACRLGNLARDETVTVTLKATAAATGTSSLTFAVGDSVPDPNVAANNRVTVSTHIAAIPAVSTSPCTIRGTEGSDTLVGTAGRDVICGLDGNDTIRALGGNDLVFGGRGADRIFGGAGADRLYGGADDDILEGDSGRDVLSGEAGNDSLRARDRARDSVFGGPGRDHAVADRLLDRVRGVESVVRGWPV